jgi:hypothetical protein
MPLFEKKCREREKPVGTYEIYCVKSSPAEDVKGYSKVESKIAYLYCKGVGVS